MENTQKLNIWVYGAGAVGSYYGARLVQAGHNILFIARGEQLKALKEKGLQILSCRGDFTIDTLQASGEEDLDKAFEPDLIMICSKTYSNELIAQRLKQVLKKEIPLFIFQNGIKSQDIFKKVFAPQFVSRTIINIAASLEGFGVVLHRSGELVTVPRYGLMAKQLLQALESVGVPIKLSDDIERDAWSKTAWNAAFNSVTALTKRTTKPILDDTDGYKLIENICNEVYKLAKANNIDLPSDLAQQKIIYTQEKLGDISTSTLEDIKNHKQIEYKAILGDLIDESIRLNIEVPHLKTVFTLLKLFNSEHKI